MLVRPILFPLLAVGLVLGDDATEAPARPRDVTRLFNGKDLAGLTTWLKDTRRDDPRRVFRVTGDGQLQITGGGFGYVATDRPYRDYRLVVEYRWGQKTDGGRSVRNSGILLNATGPDGGLEGSWMASVECQLAQGCVGDFIVIPGSEPGAVRITADVELGPDQHPRWKPGGTPRTFAGGQQLWWSNHDPEFREAIDTRGRRDVESPVGDWTRVEITNQSGRIATRVNGVLVNECRDATPPGGKILLQTEGFELFVRTFELHPIP